MKQFVVIISVRNYYQRWKNVWGIFAIVECWKNVKSVQEYTKVYTLISVHQRQVEFFSKLNIFFTLIIPRWNPNFLVKQLSLAMFNVVQCNNYLSKKKLSTFCISDFLERETLKSPRSFNRPFYAKIFRVKWQQWTGDTSVVPIFKYCQNYSHANYIITNI